MGPSTGGGRRAEPGAKRGPHALVWLLAPLGSLPGCLLRVLEPAWQTPCRGSFS